MFKNKYLKFVALFLLAIFFGSVILNIPKVAAAPPQHFQTSLVVGSGLNGPSGFDIAPDGRIFILERSGAVKIYKNGQLLNNPFVTLPSIATGDRGLIGIAFDPDFQDNHYVYFYYTGLDKINRLVRFNAENDFGSDGPVILYETKFPSEQLHVGGSIAFGPDGKIYLGVGDNGYPPNAGNLQNPHGKILRINKDGSVPQDNPFVTNDSALPEIWAYGLRNPWRFQFDSVTGLLYSADVGDFTVEEINKIVRGGNYGWPNVEGTCSGCGYINPLYAWLHNGQSAAAVGGPVYRNTMFPTAYQGSLFFGDYALGFIKTMKLDSSGNNLGVTDFDLNAGSVVDLKQAHDGSLYYITYYPGRLYRISYSETNPVPIANAGANVQKGIAPLTVDFTSAGSSDPNGDILNFSWDFGDGTTSNNPNPIKTYSENGTYTVELTVSDGFNENKAIPVIIQVGIPPNLEISLPIEGSTYIAGDEIIINSHATDAVGNDISDASYTTEVLFHHGTHIHPFYGPFAGRSHSFIVPDSGEPDPDTWYEIIVLVTDTNGLTTKKTVNIYPENATYSITTLPENLTILLDGIPLQAPVERESVIGFRRELGSTFIQKKDEIYYQFDNWSNGGKMFHEIVLPEGHTNYIANFIPVKPFTAEYYSNTNLTGEPTIVRQEMFVNFSWGNSSPDAQIPIDNFSARFSSSQFFLSGTYRFKTETDDGVRLYVDNQLVIDKWRDQGTIPYTAEIELAQGNHQIVMEYYERGGGAVARLNWDLISQTQVEEPPIEEPSENFVGEYWNITSGSNFAIPTRTADLKRNDQSIDFNWGGGSPHPSITNDSFVARWNKQLALEAGTYKFSTTTDDGVRLYFNNQLLINKWRDQGSTTYEATITIENGTYPLVMEYYENSGGALAKLNYSKITTPPDPEPTEQFSAKYWNIDGQNMPPTIPSTEPDVTTTELEIDFDWGGGSPHPSITNNNFVAVYEISPTFTAGNYTFSTSTDDGVRLFVDNQLVIDKWRDQGNTLYSANLALTAGVHSIRMEYYENSGGAVAKLDWIKNNTPPDPEPTNDYIAKYWNLTSGQFPPTIPTTTPNLVRNELDIDNDWGQGSPHPDIQNNYFVAVWEKTQSFSAGNYRFTTTTDDGVRLYIDNQMVINKWIDQGPTPYEVELTLTEGEHNFKMEYFENTGGATAKLKIEPIDEITPEPEFDGFLGEYWNVSDMSTSPDFPTTAPSLILYEETVNFDWGGGSPDPLISIDKFMARWTKNSTFDAGTYQFQLASDDGIRLKIDGEIIFEDWTLHGYKSDIVEVHLTQGDHQLTIEYFEYTGGALAKFEQL